MNNYSMVLNAALEAGIITPEAIEKYHAAGYPVPLFTFAVWKKYGYTVKRGEHARLVVSLWKQKGNATPDMDAEALPEEEKKKRGFFLKKCFLFDKTQVEKTEEAEARYYADKEAEAMENRRDTAGPRDITGHLENIRYYIIDCDLSINKTAEYMGLSPATIRRYIDESETIDRDFHFDVTGRIEKRKKEAAQKARAKMFAA